MEIKSFTLENEEKTVEFAKNTAKNAKNGDIFCLNGDLGAGKSVFARSFIRFLLKNDGLEVPSPTFTLVQHYEAPNYPIHHFDLYRLGSAEEIYEIGWEEALKNGVCLVEWPERLEGLLPQKRVDILIEPCENDPDRRTLTMSRYD